MHYAIVHTELNVKCYFDDFEKTLEIIITDWNTPFLLRFNGNIKKNVQNLEESFIDIDTDRQTERSTRYMDINL